eukprot:TRINITY_DN12145_c0_g1_i1.p1 TRINITY_DN12145_c0_g1~~TRINITY_DN12145_c0_g1_i1.p1  ORF type:complete len:314 (+),score=74.19 TRINITY_DN12145_c0_g1_i1:998-1939(+)
MEAQLDVVIVSCSELLNPKPTTDSLIQTFLENVTLEDAMLKEALEKRGMSVLRVSWDDEKFDWGSTKVAVIRSTWDYQNRYDEFTKWLKLVEAKGTELVNHPSLLHWNVHKKYLLELSEKGIPIPRTILLKKGDKRTLADLIDSVNGKWDQKYIIKPAVSAAARHTHCFVKGEEGPLEEKLATLLSEEDMLFQEFAEKITTDGEVSLMVINGKFTHAVLKVPKKGDFRVQDDFGGSVDAYSASAEQIALSEKVISMLPRLPLYARVDLFWDNRGDVVLGEVELLEPELWFRLNEECAHRCAEALCEATVSKDR